MCASPYQEELAAARKHAVRAVRILKQAQPVGVRVLQELNVSLDRLFVSSSGDPHVGAVVFAVIVGQHWENDKGIWLSKQDKKKLLWKEMMRGRTAFDRQRLGEAKAWLHACGVAATALRQQVVVKNHAAAISLIDKGLDLLISKLRTQPADYGCAAILELLMTKMRLLRMSKPMSAELAADIEAMCTRAKRYDDRHPFIMLQLAEIDVQRGSLDRAELHINIGLESAANRKMCSRTQTHMLLLQLQARIEVARREARERKAAPSPAAAQQRQQEGRGEAQLLINPQPRADELALAAECQPASAHVEGSEPGWSCGHPSAFMVSPPWSGHGIAVELAGSGMALSTGKEMCRDAAGPGGALLEPCKCIEAPSPGSRQAMQEPSATSLSEEQRLTMPKEQGKACQDDPEAVTSIATVQGVQAKLDGSERKDEDSEHIPSTATFAERLHGSQRSSLMNEEQHSLAGNCSTSPKSGLQGEAAVKVKSEAPGIGALKAELYPCQAAEPLNVDVQPFGRPSVEMAGPGAADSIRIQDKIYAPQPMLSVASVRTPASVKGGALFHDQLPPLFNASRPINTACSTKIDKDRQHGALQDHSSRRECSYSTACNPAAPWLSTSDNSEIPAHPGTPPGDGLYEQVARAGPVALVLPQNGDWLTEASPQQPQQVPMSSAEQELGTEDLVKTLLYNQGPCSKIAMFSPHNTPDLGTDEYGNDTTDASKGNPIQEVTLQDIPFTALQGMADLSGFVDQFRQHSGPLGSSKEDDPLDDESQVLSPAEMGDAQPRVAARTAPCLPFAQQTAKWQGATQPSESAHMASSAPLHAEYYRREGNRAFKEGRHHAALHLLLKARQEDPNNAQHALNIAAAYVKIGCYDAAVDMTEVALTSEDADRGDARWWRAQALLGKAGLEHLLRPQRMRPWMGPPPRLWALPPGMSPDEHFTCIMGARQDLVAVLHAVSGRNCRKLQRVQDLHVRMNRLPAVVHVRNQALKRRAGVGEAKEGRQASNVVVYSLI